MEREKFVSLSKLIIAPAVTCVNMCPATRKEKCDAEVSNIVFSGGWISGATLTSMQ
jgi:hypothetical protein